MSTAKGMPDYYGVLGVSRDADAAAIKTAYRKLAQEYHPDRGGNAQKFRAIGAAYEVLSDPELRKQFDRGGQAIAFGARAAREIASDVFHRQVRSALRQIHQNETRKEIEHG